MVRGSISVFRNVLTAFKFLIHDVGIEGVSVEPMAPFLASLELQKGQLRKVLEGFTKKLRRMSE